MPWPIESPLLVVTFSRHRKRHRQTAEERLKRAVFAAMRDGCAKAVSPSAISRHSGLSRSLIYQHFGSVDVLVSQAIEGKISFPPTAELIVAPARENSLDRASAAFDRLLEGLEPELLDLLAWSFGNADPIAVVAMEALHSYCELLATEVVGDVAFAPLFLGKFVEHISERPHTMSPSPKISD